MENEEFEILTKDGYGTPSFENLFWNKRQQMKWSMTLFFGCFLLYSSRTSMSICVVEIAKEYDWDKSLSGMVMSAFFFGYILTQILSGVLSDRFGGERVLFLSATIWSISTFLIPFVKNILPVNVGFIALRILTGVAQGFYFPALTSLVSKNIHPNNRNFAYSFAASGTSMGSIFSGLIGSLLLDYSGWRSVFLLIGSLCMIWVFMLKIFIQLDFNYDNIVVVNQNVVSFNWKSLKTSKPFWTLLFCSTCESLVFTLLLSWVPTYFHDEFPQSKGWLFNVIPWVASFFIENICGILSDEMLKKGKNDLN